jgi:hypothetical protein
MSEEIRSIIDKFVGDEYMDSKDELRTYIKTKRDEFLQDRLGLENPLNEDPESSDIDED